MYIREGDSVKLQSFWSAFMSSTNDLQFSDNMEESSSGNPRMHTFNRSFPVILISCGFK